METSLIMPSFQELIQQQDPEALRLQHVLDVYTARTKASDRVKTAAKLLDDMQAAEADARSIRDELLADLAHQLDALTEDDAVGRAHLALDLADINDSYRQAANALCKAEDNLSDARRSLRVAEHEAAKYPFPASTP